MLRLWLYCGKHRPQIFVGMRPQNKFRMIYNIKNNRHLCLCSLGMNEQDCVLAS